MFNLFRGFLRNSGKLGRDHRTPTVWTLAYDRSRLSQSTFFTSNRYLPGMLLHPEGRDTHTKPDPYCRAHFLCGLMMRLNIVDCGHRNNCAIFH